MTYMTASSARRDDPTDNVSPPERRWTTNNVAEATPGVLTSLAVTLFVDNTEVALRQVWADWGIMESNEVFLPDLAGDRIGNTAFRGRHAVSIDTMMHYKNQLPAAIVGGTDDLYGEWRVGAATQSERAMRIRSLMDADEATHADELRRTCEDMRRWWSASVAVRDADLAHLRGIVATADSMFLRAMTRHLKSRFLHQEALAQVSAVVPDPGERQRLTAGAGVEEIEGAAELWDVAHGNLSLEAFLARRGYHGPAEGDVRASSWRETPEILAPMVTELTRAKVSEHPYARLEEARTQRAATFARVTSSLSAASLDALRAAMARETAAVACLERGKAAYLMAIDAMRFAARALGAGYQLSGVLDEPEDVFHLRVDELAAELPADARELVGKRRTAWAGHCAISIPTMWMGNPKPVETAGDNGARRELLGLAASPGVATGRARIVADPSRVRGFGRGDIVVAPVTNPSWTPLLMLCGGLVVDLGTANSHAAIIARDLQVPCVMNTERAMTTLRDGDLVRVDGGAGIVTVLERLAG